MVEISMGLFFLFVIELVHRKSLKPDHSPVSLEGKRRG